MADSMEKHLFNLRFASKEMESRARMCEKAHKNAFSKLKKAIQQGNLEGAKIYAENAIRNKNQALNFRRMASRVEGVSQRVQMAVSMRKVTGSMTGVVKSMDAAMRSMDIEKVSELMDHFEKQFESLDVQAGYLDSTMQSTTTTVTPQSEVDALMKQAADEAGIDLNLNLPVVESAGASTVSAEQDELSQRLARLREF